MRRLAFFLAWFPVFYGTSTVDWTDTSVIVRCPLNVKPPSDQCVVVTSPPATQP